MMNNVLAGGRSPVDFMLKRQIKRNYNELAKSKEELETGKEGSSLLCVECGACVPKCPQSINIPEELKKVNEVISKQKITVKEVIQLMSYAVRNWRLVLSHIRQRGFS